MPRRDPQIIKKNHENQMHDRQPDVKVIAQALVRCDLPHHGVDLPCLSLNTSPDLFAFLDVGVDGVWSAKCGGDGRKVSEKQMCVMPIFSKW